MQGIVNITNGLFDFDGFSGILGIELHIDNMDVFFFPSYQFIKESQDGPSGPDYYGGLAGPILITGDYVLEILEDWDMSVFDDFLLPDGNGYTKFDYDSDLFGSYDYDMIQAVGGDIGPFRYVVYPMNGNKVGYFVDFLTDQIIPEGLYWPWRIYATISS